MSTVGDVTLWVQQLQAGDRAAAEHLWNHYFKRLVGLARKKLQGTPRLVSDEQDVALSALKSFFIGIEAGDFRHLTDRDSLWPLLAIITARKASDVVRSETRQKRGGGAVLGEAALAPPEADGPRALEQIAGDDLTPEVAAVMVEEIERLFQILTDEPLREVARLKMEGYTNEEIAAKQSCVLRTVERKLNTIRSIWEQSASS